MKKIHLGYSLIFLVLLNACSPTSSSWSCKATLNGMCKSIGEIDSGYNDKLKSNSINLKDEKNSKKNKEDNLKNITSFDDYRSEEKVSRVMFSPYIDEAGNRHDKSIVYYLEQKAEWKK
jgi:hypothetical protein